MCQNLLAGRVELRHLLLLLRLKFRHRCLRRRLIRQDRLGLDLMVRNHRNRLRWQLVKRTRKGHLVNLEFVLD